MSESAENVGMCNTFGCWYVFWKSAFSQFQIALVLAADDLTGICGVLLALNATVKFSAFQSLTACNSFLLWANA